MLVSGGQGFALPLYESSLGEFACRYDQTLKGLINANDVVG